MARDHDATTAARARAAPTVPAGGVAPAGFDGAALLAGAMLAFAPWWRGAKPPVALLILTLSGLLVIGVLAWRRSWLALDRWAFAALLALVAAFLLPLLPVPAGWWAQLPGRATIAADLAVAGIERDAWVPLSLTPSDSAIAALKLVAPLAMFACTLAATTSVRRALVHVLLVVAALDALLALVQFPQGPDSPLRLAMPWAESSGSYTNRNHLAGLLEMALPPALALLVAALAEARERFGTPGALLHAAPLSYLGLALAIVLGLVFSRSRAGLLLAMLGMLLCAFAFARTALGPGSRRAIYGVALAAIAAAAAIGAWPVLQRFAATDLGADSRIAYTATTLRAARDWFPLGSGPGSFDRVYPRYAGAADLGPAYVNEAHNDYAQALLEGGVPLALAIVLGLVVYARGWRGVRRMDEPLRDHCLRVGAGIALGLMLLHTAADYNLQTPANALVFALLAGLFLADPRRESASLR
jgi:O-antigen ligase